MNSPLPHGLFYHKDQNIGAHIVEQRQASPSSMNSWSDRSFLFVTLIVWKEPKEQKPSWNLLYQNYTSTTTNQNLQPIAGIRVKSIIPKVEWVHGSGTRPLLRGGDNDTDQIWDKATVSLPQQLRCSCGCWRDISAGNSPRPHPDGIFHCRTIKVCVFFKLITILSQVRQVRQKQQRFPCKD